MKCSKRTIAVVSVFFVVSVFGVGALNAREAESAAVTLATTQTVKRQCINACRARYRDCRHLKQLPSFECRSVYQDCARYSCTGLGPG